MQIAQKQTTTNAGGRRWVGVVLWVLAVLLGAASMVYQRMTGPTHPLNGTLTMGDERIKYELLRSANTGPDAEISIPAPTAKTIAIIFWKRYKTDDEPHLAVMIPQDGKLVGKLPSQPAAGKLSYHIQLRSLAGTFTIPPEGDVVIRFKGAVPAFVLLPHVLAMILVIIFGMRTLLEALWGRSGIRLFSWLTFWLIVLGGMILGPLVQKYAFGAYWTGVPFGWDLTDNKVLVMFLIWLITVIMLGVRAKPVPPVARWMVFLAALVMIAVYLVPHSMFGSQLDYSKVDQGVPAEQAIGQG